MCPIKIPMCPIKRPMCPIKIPMCPIKRPMCPIKRPVSHFQVVEVTVLVVIEDICSVYRVTLTLCS